MNCDEIKPLLNARLDGETDPLETADLESHVATCPRCAAEFSRLAATRNAIREAMPFHKAPAELRDRVRFALRGAAYLDRPAPKPRWPVWGAVAAAISLCVLGSALLLLTQRQERRLIAEDFLSAHQRALMSRPVDVVSSDRHTVKPWFNGKLPFSPPVDDLASEGFPLEGGRLDYVAGNPVAALVYRRRLHRIDLFVQPGLGGKAPSHFEQAGFTELSWTKGTFSFTAVSDLNPAELSTFAGLLKNK